MESKVENPLLNININRQPDSGHGFIYILRNDSMPGIYKIGLTTNSIKRRIQELNTTGVPTTFIAEKIFEVPDGDLATIEKETHRKLKNKELHHGKEFFEAKLSICVEAVEDVIFEVTGWNSADIVGQAHERAKAREAEACERAKAQEADARKLRSEIKQLKLIQREQLILANKQIDTQRNEYAEEAIKNIKDREPFLVKYDKPLAVLLLLVIGGVAAWHVFIEDGFWGWLFSPVSIGWAFWHDINKTKEKNANEVRREAEIAFPYKY